MRMKLPALVVLAVAACGTSEVPKPCGYVNNDPPYCVDPPGYAQVKGKLDGVVTFSGLTDEPHVKLEPVAVEGSFGAWVASRTDEHEPTPLPNGNGVVVVREERLGTSRIVFLETYLDVAPGKVVVCSANTKVGDPRWPAVIDACKSLRRR